MATTTDRRHWQMRRLATGDYLLPANSVQETDRYYRLTKWDDGPYLGTERNRIRWGVFMGYGHQLDDLSLTLSPWGMREWAELGDHDTRTEAVAAALSHDERNR